MIDPSQRANESRKPPEQSFDSFIEQRIQEAMTEGAFEKLPGFGKPLPEVTNAADENWWLKDKLRRENVNAIPLTLEVKLEREKTLAELAQAKTESEVRARLETLNAKIRQAHYSTQNGPPNDTLPVDIEAEVERWQQTRTDSH